MKKYLQYIVLMVTMLSSILYAIPKIKDGDHKLGINYEGNKIIKYIKKSPHCLGYLNVQIAMDAPFLGYIADEEKRAKGRTEKQIEGYDENKLIAAFRDIFNDIITIADQYRCSIVIQIARGRSGEDFFQNVIKKSISNYSEVSQKITIVYGYRSTTYFNYEKQTTKFVFLNIGMFARLTPNIKVGELFIPDISLDITRNDDSKMITVDCYSIDQRHNILGFMHNRLPAMCIAGIDDTMPFITPSLYKEYEILSLFETAENSALY